MIFRLLVGLLVLLFMINPIKTNAYISNEISPPSVMSEAAILIDSQSGQVLYEKNSEKQMYPASITKIATAILAIEQGNLTEKVTVSQKARNVDGTRVYLEEGEQVPLYKLIQGLLINSGNDAAIAIAEHMDGSVEAFAKHMNQFIEKKIGVKNTHFTNPHGLFDENHYTTAHDIASIMQYAMKNETFREIISTEQLEWHGESWDTTLYNHHKMLRERPYEGIIGGKTGFVNQSKQTLVTAAERENIALIAVVLKADTKKMEYDDTEALLDFGFNHYQSEMIPAGTQYKNKKEQIYITDKPIFFAKLIGEEVHPEVSANGKLSLKSESGNILLKHKLKEVKNMALEEPSKDNNQEHSAIQPQISGLILFIVFAIIGSIGVIIKKLKFNRNMKY